MSLEASTLKVLCKHHPLLFLQLLSQEVKVGLMSQEVRGLPLPGRAGVEAKRKGHAHRRNGMGQAQRTNALCTHSEMGKVFPVFNLLQREKEDSFAQRQADQ